MPAGYLSCTRQNEPVDCCGAELKLWIPLDIPLDYYGLRECGNEAAETV